MRRKALRVGACDPHVQPALRIFVDVCRRWAAFRRFAASVGIPRRGKVVDNVLEALEAAVAVSSRRLLRGRRWRGLFWRRWRRWRGWISVDRPRGGDLLRFLPRQWFDDLVDRRRFSIITIIR